MIMLYLKQLDMLIYFRYVGNVLGFYLKLITRKGFKKWAEFTRKIILNLFVRQLKTKLLTKENICQLTPYWIFTEKMSTKIPGGIIFISSGYRIQEVVISSHCLETKTIAESIASCEMKWLKQTNDHL